MIYCKKEPPIPIFLHNGQKTFQGLMEIEETGNIRLRQKTR